MQSIYYNSAEKRPSKSKRQPDCKQITHQEIGRREKGRAEESGSQLGKVKKKGGGAGKGKARE